MSASKLRGDDDLFAALNDLSSAQGYEVPAAIVTQPEIVVNDAHTPPKKRLRLSIENNCIEDCQKAAGPESIWNPRVHIDNTWTPSPRSCCLVPTNPQVEVFRRRAFERFKERIKDIFERIVANSTKRGVTNLWSDLHTVSFFERWHLVAKLSEAAELKSTRPPENLSSPLKWTTPRVHDLINEASTHHPFWVDPILISTPLTTNYKQKVLPHDETLMDELKFEWLRTWRRISCSKDRDDEVERVFKSKKFQSKSMFLLREVKLAACDAMASFRKDLAKRAQEETLQSSTLPKRPSPKVVQNCQHVSASFSGLKFSINLEHYNKVVSLFDRNNRSRQSEEEHKASFFSSLFCLLARYDTIQGPGLQAALPGAVFDALLTSFGCTIECFASPLNCRYERFFSAFPDTDAPFGSLGSFFHHDFLEGGAYQANPPFTDSFILSMCRKMEMSLRECEQPLMFIVFIPAWTNMIGWKALKESPFTQRDEKIYQASHYFTEGTQYRRKASNRLASFDTTVFFLQNEQGSKKWKIEDEHARKLKLAFDLS